MANTPTPYEYEQTHDRKLLESICVAAVVQVTSFDKKKMTVNLQPLSKHLVHGKYESQPPILRVPIICFRSNGFIFRPFCKKGDIGIVLYLDHDMDSTVSGGKEAEPLTERTHSTTDAIFIGGIVSGEYKLPDTLPDDAFIFTKEDGTLYISVTKEKIALKNVETTAEFTADAISMTAKTVNISATENLNLRGERININ